MRECGPELGGRLPDRIAVSHKDNPDPYERGFYNHKNHTFISKADSGLDSADLMTKLQRMRKLGLESITDPTIKSHLSPAIKDPKTNKIYVGRRGIDDPCQSSATLREDGIGSRRLDQLQ
jgi:hypothetical protein